MKRTRLSDSQCLQATALGLKVDSEGGLVELVADTSTKVFNLDQDQRRPVLVRIQNISGGPLHWSEGKGKCDADILNGVLQKDSAGGANPEGDGGGIEFQRHIPRNVYIWSLAGGNVLITIRYAE